MRTKNMRLATIFAVLLIASTPLHAACVNKFVSRADGNKKILTLLTGMLTFAEAQELGQQLAKKGSQPVEWIDDNGKIVASAVQFQPVRPMPVKCADKPSGSVVNVTFLTFASPGKSLTIKFTETLSVAFEEQAK